MDALVGAVLLLALAVIVGVFFLECATPITQTVTGTVVKRTMVMDILDEVPGTYIYTVWVEADGKTYKFTVDKTTYFALPEGTEVQIGLAIGRIFGSACTAPVLIAP